MPQVTDFPIDNLGSPDTYTVQTTCRRIRIREKDRSVATQATFNVYFGNGATPRPHEQGEECLYAPDRFIMPGEKIRLESVNVGAAVMSIIEE